jgi:hypothetical protein
VGIGEAVLEYEKLDAQKRIWMITSRITLVTFMLFSGLRLVGLLDVVDPQAQTWIDVISGLGSTGALVFLVWMFMSGKILSAAVYDKQMETWKQAVETLITTRVTEEVTKAVKRGFIDAWYEMRDNDGNNPAQPMSGRPGRPPGRGIRQGEEK